MDNSSDAATGGSESTNGQVNQEPFDENLVEASSPPLLSPENQDLVQRAWNDGVVRSLRAREPPMLMPMAEAGTCQPANPVQVEQMSKDASGKKVSSRKKPKRMTPRRREIITGFLLEVYADLGKYGYIGGPSWMNELLLRIRGDNGRFEYVQVTDVANWLNVAEFKEDYEKLLSLQRDLQGTSSSASSAAGQPLQNAKPIGPQEPVKLAPPPVQPAPFATAFAATAQVTSAQPELGSSNLQGAIGDDGITYQTQLPPNSNFFVNQRGLPILPADLWQHIKEEKFENQPQMQPHLFFQPGGIVVQLPPSATSTTLYIQPTSWAAYVANCNDEEILTGANEEVRLGAVKLEKDVEHKLKKEEDPGSDFSGDQFMGYMGEPTDAQE